MDDTIYRQAAIDALGEEPEVWTGKDDYAQGLNNQWHYDVNALKAVPPADTDLSAYSDKLWRAAYERGKREAEAERKRGKWILKNHLYECDNCGCRIKRFPFKGNIWNYNFCPNCGEAKGDGEQV